MIFLLNVLFRFLHVLMVLLPSQRVITPWLRQMASEVWSQLTAEHQVIFITTVVNVRSLVSAKRQTLFALARQSLAERRLIYHDIPR
ncbi:hypothetical protein XZ90_001482 [Salmonella enterica subsp. enterica]|uniref:Uncharacterized protein n=1 Tax=Citrobacter braakii TaxID=57706 RepID=A0A1V8NU27_CITBR|nr:hypothetical protein [Citrobacter braakii]EDV0068800.1 hypothetical protein [Salmonella enterica subsp. enterica serovar Litchfield]EDV1957989.1 hypothetical protein [Salmonella enterica subsp. enterica serovar Litchfield]OQM39903.1 hypothetical protein BZK42_21810 [Citrobacter braakii]QXC16645.1 hypothetical protein I6L51_00460 [Citrobacter braakii]